MKTKKNILKTKNFYEVLSSNYLIKALPLLSAGQQRKTKLIKKEMDRQQTWANKPWDLCTRLLQGFCITLHTEAGPALSAKRVGKRCFGMSRQQQPGQGCEPRAWLREFFLLVFPPGITWAADLHTEPSLAQQLPVRESCPAGEKKRSKNFKGEKF